MEIMRLIGIAVCGVVLSSVLRSFGRRDAALLGEIACGVLMLAMVLSMVRGAVSSLPDITEKIDIDDGLVQLLLKVTGVAVLAELAAQLCRDAGVSALAQKIELGGKVVILCAAMPMMLALCDCMLSLLS